MFRHRVVALNAGWVVHLSSRGVGASFGYKQLRFDVEYLQGLRTRSAARIAGLVRRSKQQLHHYELLLGARLVYWPQSFM